MLQSKPTNGLYELTFPPNCGAHLLSGANGKAAQKHSSKRAGERPAMAELRVSLITGHHGSYLAKWNDILPTYIHFHEIGEFLSLPQLPFGVRSCEVVIMFDQITYSIIMNSTTDVENLWRVLAIVSQNFDISGHAL